MKTTLSCEFRDKCIPEANDRIAPSELASFASLSSSTRGEASVGRWSNTLQRNRYMLTSVHDGRLLLWRLNHLSPWLNIWCIYFLPSSNAVYWVDRRQNFALLLTYSTRFCLIAWFVSAVVATNYSVEKRIKKKAYCKTMSRNNTWCI